MIETRNKIQQEALESVMDNGGSGTIICTPATGKSWICYKWFHFLLEGYLKEGDEVACVSITEFQSRNLEEERDKYEKVYGKIPLQIDFVLYASKPDKKYKAIAFDEFDYAISPIYSKTLLLYKQMGIPMLCMSGTLKYSGNPYSTMELGFTTTQQDYLTKNGIITPLISRKQLFDIVCPKIVFTYTFQQAREDGLIVPFKSHQIPHFLGKEKIIQITKKWIGSEQQMFDWYEKVRKDKQTDRNYKMILNRNIIPVLYWNLPSKVKIIKDYISSLEGPIILFGVRNSLLCQITPYVIESKSSPVFTFNKNGWWTYSKTGSKGKFKYTATNCKTLQKHKINKESYDLAKAYWKDNLLDSKQLYEDFNKGLINIIGASKSIGRGVTPKRVRHIVVASYSSVLEDIIQKLARGWRLEENKDVVHFHFFITQDAIGMEKKWFKKMQKSTYRGKIINEIKL